MLFKQELRANLKCACNCSGHSNPPIQCTRRVEGEVSFQTIDSRTEDLYFALLVSRQFIKSVAAYRASVAGWSQAKRLIVYYFNTRISLYMPWSHYLMTRSLTMGSTVSGSEVTRPHHVKNNLCFITVKTSVILWGFEGFKILKISRGSRRGSNIDP